VRGDGSVLDQRTIYFLVLPASIADLRLTLLGAESRDRAGGRFFCEKQQIMESRNR
jgi:hypothetical protein